MNSNSGLRNWIIIIVLLAAFALVTAVWSGLVSNAPTPSLSVGGSDLDTSAIPVETEDIDFEIKPIQWTMSFPTLFGIEIPGFDITVFPGYAIDDINPLVAIGVLFGLVIVGIGVIGGAIATPILLLSRTVTNVKESESFQESEQRLANAEKALIKDLNEGRSIRADDHVRPRWSAISTSLIILMFAWFVALVLNGTFFPEGFTFLGGDPDRYLRTTPLFVWITLGATALALIAWMRPKSLQSAESAESEGGVSAIPWDTIAVMMTGLVIVGLGIGAMVYLLNQTG